MCYGWVGISTLPAEGSAYARLSGDARPSISAVTGSSGCVAICGESPMTYLDLLEQDCGREAVTLTASARFEVTTTGQSGREQLSSAGGSG